MSASEERSIAMIGIAAVAVMALIMSVGSLIVGAGRSDARVAPAGSPAPSSVTVTLTEFAISPADIVLAPGGTITLINAGAAEHNFVIEGAGIESQMLAPGTRTQLSIGALAPGFYGTLCTVPGHDSGGMRGTLTVAGPDFDPDAAPMAAMGGSMGAMSARNPNVDWVALDHAMDESILRFPAATEGLGNQPLEFELLEDGTKLFRLVAEVIDWEVEPGRFVEGWAYNGQIPGPLIKVDVGDRVRIDVENRLPLGTDVHWHGVIVPNVQDGVAPLTQDLIAPGETFSYEFTTTETSVGMYHPHHHGQMKLPNGMFGVFLVGDLDLPRGRTISGRAIPADLVVSQEIPMVVNDAGTIGLTLNGKSFPATAPIVAAQDEWVLMHYYNEGLTVHPMHLHGFPQLVVGRDGFPLNEPYWADTVTVAPGERFSVLIKAEHLGVWAFHCHILTHAERAEGMFGMVTAFIVTES
jgi:manganese oxidase